MDDEFDTSTDVSSDVDTSVSDADYDDVDTSDVSDDIPEDDYSDGEDYTDDVDDYEEDTDSFDEDVDVDDNDFIEEDIETEDIDEDSMSEIEEDSESENFENELSDVDDIEEDTEDFDEIENMESSEEMDEIEEDTEELQENSEETDDVYDVIEEDTEESETENIDEEISSGTEDDVTEDATAETEEDVAEDTTVETEGDVEEDTTAETEGDVAEDTTTETEGDVAEDTTAETEEDETEDTTVETEEDVAEDTTTETEEDVAEDTTSETEEDVAEDTTAETEEDVAEDTTSETEEDVEEDVTAETEGDVEEDTTAETEGDVAEDAIAESEDDVTEDTTAETEGDETEGTTAETEDDDSGDAITEASVVQEKMDDFVMYDSDNMVANESNDSGSEMGEENIKDNLTESDESNYEVNEGKNSAVGIGGGIPPQNSSESGGGNPPSVCPVCGQNPCICNNDVSDENSPKNPCPVCGQDPCVCGDIHEGDKTSFEKLSEYMNEHNYGPDDFATYSQDPVWRTLHREVYPDYEMPELSQENARAQLSEYMNEHNYGIDDFATYSQDPVWRELHGAAYPDYEMPTEKGNGDVSTEFVTGKEMIEQFGVEKHRYGSDYFVRGDHYNQFESDYYTADNSTYTEYDTPQERDISPSLIEGIHLGKGEIENPSVFWEQHESGGTAESFQEIASHIPEVREKLAAGATLDDLDADDKLSKCANIYFRNKPQVVERDGYYEFDSNGRHRILAARALGYDIPVSVVGKRSYNDAEISEFDAPILGENSELDSAMSTLEDSMPQNELSEDFELGIRAPRTEYDSKEYSLMADALEKANVEFRPIQVADQHRTSQDIINRLSGGDMTKGSCSSLALAYAGNKAGYDVLDFRDGDSRSFFSSRNSIQMVADMPNIKSAVLDGTNDIETANQLLSYMQEGKEYYLATGGHAAIVRQTGTNYEYLELQHPSNGNGWHILNNNILQHRFGCRESRMAKCSSFLMDVDSMANSQEFKNILGFINTAEFKQRKGVPRNVR